MSPDGATDWTEARSASAVAGGSAPVLPLFAVTLGLSAFLLFLVQPLFAKLVLPLLGGAPAVWNTAMVFFQTALLAGYLYAHLVVRLRPFGAQLLLHVGILAAALIALPVAVPEGWAPPAERNPLLPLIGLMTVTVGIPFFVVSATGPLLQKWFAGLEHAAARDPYFLYGASNLGSVLALLCFPLLVEPLLTLPAQTGLWTGGYVVLALLIALCALAAWRSSGPARVLEPVIPATPSARVDAAPLTWRRRAHWTVLAFAPSSLLLGVTAHITTDVAAAPLFWVVPLTLYLLTFVVVFARRPLLGHAWVVAAQPFVVIPLALFFWVKIMWAALPLHLLAFFVLALVCHGELVKRRPATRHLTEFYVWLSVGGMLGGVFNALIAPLAFDWVYEYPLAIVLACALRPLPTGDRRAVRAADIALPAAVLALAMLAVLALDRAPDTLSGIGLIVLFAAVATFVYGFRRRPLRFALGIGAAMVVVFSLAASNDIIVRERSFFGVHKVRVDGSGRTRELVHGNTLHGAQFIDPARWREPLIYYHRDGPLGQVFAAMAAAGRPGRVAVIGLGTGAVACYRQPGQPWTFYEIDPTVERIARDTRYFHYMSECAGDARVVLGDARLSLRQAPSAGYDLMILDAYSSDAVPVHLLTRQALALYLDKLAPGGLLAFHVSNRHLSLRRVVARLVADAGLVGRHVFHDPDREVQEETLVRPSEWVVAARAPADLAAFDESFGWRETTAAGEPVWRDDFSNIIGVLRWR